MAFLLPFWQPLMPLSELAARDVHGARVEGRPLVVYRKNATTAVVHSDICPHMGGSFCQGGWLNDERSLCCPYHGFEFDEGRFVGIPSASVAQAPPRARKSAGMAAGMGSMATLMHNGYLYCSDANPLPATMPYFPPEHGDPGFVAVSGTRVVDCPVDCLVENLLDMLHISFVHSFGNMAIPLPENIRYQELGETGGRAYFEYTPNEFTIARKIGGVERVRVENEFHMGTTTLTRVIAGSTIKTVFTQSLPISDTQTRLFWTVYRNFWRDPYMRVFSWPGDVLLRVLMERTIDEDASILARAYPEGRLGFLTRYDITIRRYREKKAEMVLNHGRRRPMLSSFLPSFDI